jgi:hypothetical protein
MLIHLLFQPTKIANYNNKPTNEAKIGPTMLMIVDYEAI